MHGIMQVQAILLFVNSIILLREDGTIDPKKALFAESLKYQRQFWSYLAEQKNFFSNLIKSIPHLALFGRSLKEI
jgi:hypothetical protein